MFGRHADARSCSLILADAPARFTSPRCFSSVDCWDEDAPGLSRCSGASGCRGPLLAYRSRGMLVAVGSHLFFLIMIPDV